MQMIKTILQSFQTIHTETKRLLLFCCAYIALILTADVVLCLLAGHALSYYAAMQWAGDLFATVRPCVGIAALGSLLTEGALHTE